MPFSNLFSNFFGGGRGAGGFSNIRRRSQQRPASLFNGLFPGGLRVNPEIRDEPAYDRFLPGRGTQRPPSLGERLAPIMTYQQQQQQQAAGLGRAPEQKQVDFNVRPEGNLRPSVYKSQPYDTRKTVRRRPGESYFNSNMKIGSLFGRAFRGLSSRFAPSRPRASQKTLQRPGSSYFNSNRKIGSLVGRVTRGLSRPTRQRSRSRVRDVGR